MNRFNIEDFTSLSRVGTNPQMLRAKIGDVIASSTTCHAKIEALDPDTGEYRVVLQGTIGKAGIKPTAA
jgi:hypothetical protein